MRNLALGLAATPLLAAIWTILLLAAAPRQPADDYLGLHFGLAGVLLLASGRAFPASLRDQTMMTYRGMRASRLTLLRIDVLVIAGALGISVVTMLLYVFVVPLIDNDALEYALVARAVYEQRDIGIYPLLEPDPKSGMYAPWTHPPMYVALIALSYMLQGSGEWPGLMRLIAPFCLAGVAAVCACLASKDAWGRTGPLLTITLLMSTPLLHRMTGGGSIDALAMVGYAAAFAAWCLYRESRRAWVLAGTLLGLSLWTHSQALLYVPLLLGAIIAAGLAERRAFMRECATIGAIGILLGAAPYVRNFALFGSPISDNNVVFRLPELDWETYFTLGRGIESLPDQILFGVFRGWTNVESFGWTFWLASFGVALAIASGLRAGSLKSPVLWSSVAVLAVYHGGMLVSVLIGTEQMIKNDRYLLPMLPHVCLLGAYAIARTVFRDRTP